MSNSFNSNAVVQSLDDAVAMDPKVKAVLYAGILEKTADMHNAFKAFTSSADPRGMNGGVRSIFAQKRDLKAGGADTVNFTIIGPPGGNGVMGNQELTGNTSKSMMATYGVSVGWHRDGFEYDRETLEFLTTGKMVVATTLDLLGQKMGFKKQNHMMMRLIKAADGNVYRPNNRASTNDLLETDTLGLAIANDGRTRLTTMGARPLMRNVSKTGSPVDGYLTFASNTAFLPLRNDDSYQVALARAHTEGDSNALFTGKLVDWSGMPFYECPVTDQDWDDYIGSPMEPKAKLSTAFSTASASAACLLRGETYLATPLPGTPRYFQFFEGYDYRFQQRDDAVVDSAERYAWIVNPDGSVGFVAYTGSNNNGNSILVTKILSKNGAGTSTKGATTVGELVVNTSASPDEWTGGNATIPEGYTYTDSFVSGAIILQANAKGVTYGRGWQFGAMSACFADGRIPMAKIGQDRDFGFTEGHGFEMIFGTGVAKNPFKKPTGYLLLEFAIQHPGYNTPSKIAA